LGRGVADAPDKKQFLSRTASRGEPPPWGWLVAGIHIASKGATSRLLQERGKPPEKKLKLPSKKKTFPAGKRRYDCHHQRVTEEKWAL